MTDLAKLVVTLEAQTAKFQKELEKSNRKLARFGKRANDVTRGVNQAFSALAIGALTRKVIQSTAKQEQAFKQLEKGIESTNGVVGFSADELARYAQELQGVTTFGDEDIIAAQSKLVTFTQITGDQFKRATELALDMSARFGTDASQAAIQFGKALNDPIANLGALSKAGIQFSVEQKKLIKGLIETGDKVGAQKIILEELETQFGGSARAARDTFGGALDGLTNVIGDLLEGKSGLSEAQQKIDQLTKSLSDPKTQQAADKLTATLINGFSNLVTILAEVPDFATFLGEEIAAAIHGPTDLIRIQEAITEKTKEIEQAQIALNRALAVGDKLQQNGITKRLEDLNSELELLRQKAELQKPTTAPKIDLSDTTSVNPGLSSSTSAPTSAPDLDALKEAQRTAEQVISETTPRIEKLQEKVLRTAELFSQGLLNPEQFEQATQLYQSQIEEITNRDLFAFEEKLVRLEEQFTTEYDLLTQQRDARLALLDEEYASQIRSEEEVASLKLKINENYNKQKEKLDKAAAQTEQQVTLQSAHAVLGILSAFAGNSFNAQKTLAVAEGGIHIFSSLLKALDLPYPSNLVAYADVAGRTASVMSKLKSVSLGSGATAGASLGASAGSSFSTPSATTQVQSFSEIQQRQQSRTKIELDLLTDEFSDAPARKFASKLAEIGPDIGLEIVLRD